jgi:argininosuccinate synthase
MQRQYQQRSTLLTYRKRSSIEITTFRTSHYSVDRTANVLGLGNNNNNLHPTHQQPPITTAKYTYRNAKRDFVSRLLVITCPDNW